MGGQAEKNMVGADCVLDGMAVMGWLALVDCVNGKVLVILATYF